MRYFVTVNFEIVENDNKMAIKKAQEFCKDQRKQFDNNCEIVYIERNGFGELESETIYFNENLR